MITPETVENNNKAKRRRWLGLVGKMGFAFFLIKGLFWLLVPAVLATIAWIK